jgi:hypothetical protein
MNGDLLRFIGAVVVIVAIGVVLIKACGMELY